MTGLVGRVTPLRLWAVQPGPGTSEETAAVAFNSTPHPDMRLEAIQKRSERNVNPWKRFSVSSVQ